MKADRYEYKTEAELLLYEFVSEGRKGPIKKIVEYSRTNVPDVYNLAFGDHDESTRETGDSIISGNGDGQKVLTTVASTAYAFTNQYPDAWIYATGSSPARTRLYRIGISTNLIEIMADFEVYGLTEDHWEKFVPGTFYKAFLVRRKIRIFGI